MDLQNALFLDTEFTELSSKGELISLAAVDYLGEQFYWEFTEWMDSRIPNDWVCSIVSDKLSGQIDLLKDLQESKGVDLNDQILGIAEQYEILQATTNYHFGTLNGIEGMAAKYYWNAFSIILSRSWGFECRSGRDAQDPFNALLNYAYGMMYHKVEDALFAVGLDPYMGIYHADEYRNAALSYDLIEPSGH